MNDNHSRTPPGVVFRPVVVASERTTFVSTVSNRESGLSCRICGPKIGLNPDFPSVGWPPYHSRCVCHITVRMTPED